MSTALGRLSQEARTRLAHDLVGAGDPDYVTGAIVVDRLTDKAAMVARFGFGPEWSIRTGGQEDLGFAWVIRWDHLTLHLRDAGDLALARVCEDARVSLRKTLRTMVLELVDDLGLRPRSRFLKAPR